MSLASTVMIIEMSTCAPFVDHRVEARSKNYSIVILPRDFAGRACKSLQFAKVVLDTTFVFRASRTTLTPDNMSGADLVQPVQGLLAALTASTAAAGGAAGIEERGGTAAAPRAWSGDGSEETKKRLKASIVRLKSGRFDYIPA